MGFSSLRELNDAHEAGQTLYSVWRKTPSVTTVSGVWMDLSGAPGFPVPNYFAASPLEANVLVGARGLFHGANVEPSGKTMHLQRTLVMSNSGTGLPVTFIMCDYLLYYPYTDQGVTDPQALDNTTATLPRYTDGEGVRILAVLVAAQVGGQSFQVTYTNSQGVAGRVTPTVICNTVAVTGTLVNTQTANALASGPFLPLQAGDTGVRSIESIQFNGPDIGLVTLVLVKPIASFMLRGVDAPVEVDYLRDRPSLPRIYDGAYLHFIAMPTGSLSGVSLYGESHFVWG